MLRFNLFIFLLVSSLTVEAQRENNWIIGAGHGYPNVSVSFNNGIFSDTITGHNIPMGATKACISDTSGNLLFYTNGIDVYTSQHDTMQNGMGLNPSTFTFQNQNNGLNIIQSCLILPIPDSSNLYYLFHYTIDTLYTVPPPLYQAGEVHTLYYSEIDMSRNAGSGECVAKNIHLLDDTLDYGGLTATRHANGRDWWILMKKYNQPLYYTWIVTPFGILGPYTQSIGPVAEMWGLWQGCFSEQGDKYASVLDQPSPTKDLYLYDFNRCSGSLRNMNHIQVADSFASMGCAFSPSGRFLYYSSRHYLYQFDTHATNVSASMIVVAVYVYDSLISGFPTDFAAMQLAPDGKIYLSTANGTDRLHVIEYPDSAGLACNVVQHAIQLQWYNDGSLPNLPNFHLGALEGSACDTITGMRGVSKDNLNNILVYPNPANDFVTFYFPVSLSSTTRCVITNVLGQEVMKKEIAKGVHEQIISVKDFPVGMYYYNFIVKGDAILNSGKFIVR